MEKCKMMKKRFCMFICRVVRLCSLSITFSTGISKSGTNCFVFRSDSLITHFEDLSYKRNNDFYKNDPLPRNDCFYHPILSGWFSDPSICNNGKAYSLVINIFSHFSGVSLFHCTDIVNRKQFHLTVGQNKTITI